MKRAKRTIIEYTETKSEYSSYKCPHCHINFTGAGIRRNITRFKCTECDNEIIVDRL